MKLFDFKEGDEVRITKTPLVGKIIKLGGAKATVQINESSEITIDLSRLRHIKSFAERKLDEAKELLEKARKTKLF
jgi:preprotein translocase subunit YajC